MDGILPIAWSLLSCQPVRLRSFRVATLQQGTWNNNNKIKKTTQKPKWNIPAVFFSLPFVLLSFFCFVFAVTFLPPCRRLITAS